MKGLDALLELEAKRLGVQVRTSSRFVFLVLPAGEVRLTSLIDALRILSWVSSVKEKCEKQLQNT